MIEEPQFPKGFKAVLSYLFGSLKEEYSDFFEKYHPYDGPRGYLQTLEDLANEHPKIVFLETPEVSTEGRKIPIARLSSNFREKPYRFMITGMIHGREFISGEVCLGILENMIRESDTLTDTEIYFLPVLNPDALVRNVEKVSKGKRFGGLRRQNPNGVDLNRNFSDNFDKRSWTNKYNIFPIKSEYAGKHAFSEEEPQFIREFVDGYGIDGAINFHSFSNVILYPPFSTKEQDPNIERIAQKMSEAMPDPYTAIQGSAFLEHCFKWLSPLVTRIRHPTVEGALDGWLYNKGIHSMVVEISKPSFPLAAISNLYAFNPPPSSLPFHVENCFQAAKTFIEETKNYLK